MSRWKACILQLLNCTIEPIIIIVGYCQIWLWWGFYARSMEQMQIMSIVPTCSTGRETKIYLLPVHVGCMPCRYLSPCTFLSWFADADCTCSLLASGMLTATRGKREEKENVWDRQWDNCRPESTGQGLTELLLMKRRAANGMEPLVMKNPLQYLQKWEPLTERVLFRCSCSSSGWCTQN